MKSKARSRAAVAIDARPRVAVLKRDVHLADERAGVVDAKRLGLRAREIVGPRDDESDDVVVERSPATLVHGRQADLYKPFFR